MPCLPSLAQIFNSLSNAFVDNFFFDMNFLFAWNFDYFVSFIHNDSNFVNKYSYHIDSNSSSAIMVNKKKFICFYY